MKIWIDADGAPGAMQEIVFRASQRLGLAVVLVANRWLATPPSRLISSVQVAAGMDVADDYIVEHCEPGDIVISGDIPLAAEAIEKGAVVLQHRGEVLDPSNIGQRVAMRDMMEELRAGGLMGGGPPPYDAKARQSFANGLDRLLARGLAQQGRP